MSRRPDPSHVTAALYGLAARLAAQRRPSALRRALLAPPGEASVLVTAVAHADNAVLRDALGSGAVAIPSSLSAFERVTMLDALERGSADELGQLVEWHCLAAAPASKPRDQPERRGVA